MAFIGTLYLFGIECKSSETKWKEYIDIDKCSSEWHTIYRDSKGLFCGESKSKGMNRCEEDIYYGWKTTYYNSNREYCGKSVSKMVKDTERYTQWSTEYYDSNGTFCGTTKSIDLIWDDIFECYSNDWKTVYYDVNGIKCGESVSKRDLFSKHYSADHWNWKTEYHNGNGDKHIDSENDGCGFFNWLNFFSSTNN
jgi:hypothetical protein